MLLELISFFLLLLGCFFFHYSGKSGHVFIENGTRVPEFVVGNLRDGSYKFVGNRTNLRQNGSGSIYHKLRLFYKSEIRWPGGSRQVPVSDPVCGFTGKGCQQVEESTGKNIDIDPFRPTNAINQSHFKGKKISS